MDPTWLDWVRRLQAIAQNGLTYARDPYDIDRYNQLLDIAAEIVASQEPVSVEQVRNIYARETGHATPKVDVRGVIFQGDKVLLVKERADGRWTVPGGWADIGDSPAEATLREIQEESGYEARIVKLMALYDRMRHDHPPHAFHIYKVFFLCEITGGAPSTSNETDGVEFFSLNQLPELSVGRVTAKQIRRFYEHYLNPGLPTDYD